MPTDPDYTALTIKKTTRTLVNRAAAKLAGNTQRRISQSDALEILTMAYLNDWTVSDTIMRLDIIVEEGK